VVYAKSRVPLPDQCIARSMRATASLSTVRVGWRLALRPGDGEQQKGDEEPRFVGRTSWRRLEIWSPQDLVHNKVHPTRFTAQGFSGLSRIQKSHLGQPLVRAGGPNHRIWRRASTP
jgi:hypothetical protein